jgi:hypothetical protein
MVAAAILRPLVADDDPRTPTGYVIGRTYLSLLAGQPYTVEQVTTLWEYAPDGAVVVRWANGNRTVRADGPGDDPVICPGVIVTASGRGPCCALAAS